MMNGGNTLEIEVKRTLVGDRNKASVQEMLANAGFVPIDEHRFEDGYGRPITISGDEKRAIVTVSGLRLGFDDPDYDSSDLSVVNALLATLPGRREYRIINHQYKDT